jgi:hypothetical protein
METCLEKQCEELRTEILKLDKWVLSLKKHSEITSPEEFEGQRGEQVANIMLAYRHLEDARMRLGKVMQQCQGGVSIFDRK